MTTATATAAAVTTAYPTIPTLEPRTADESPREFGLRAFRFLLTESLCACVLPSSTLEQAIAASQLMTSADVADAARERFHAIRLDIMRTLDRRNREEKAAAKAAAVVVNAPKPQGGKPAPLRRPTPIIPPATTARRM